MGNICGSGIGVIVLQDISADQVTGNPKVKGIYQQGKAITPVMRKLCLGKERRLRRTLSSMVSM
jgi:hypothetical protein